MKRIAIDDSIMKVNSPIMKETEMFNGYISPINAEVITRLENNGYTVDTLVSTPDFGISSLFSEDNSIPEGVSLVKNDEIIACLYNDLFGEYRRHAAINDLIYIHPTYGTVSRYGLVPFAPSMDQIGVLCKDIDEGYKILKAISGYDSKDGVMFSESVSTPKSMVGGIRIAVDESISDSLPLDNICKVSLPHSDIYNEVFTILYSAEFSHSTNRYDGVRHGYRSNSATTLEDIYVKSRSEGLSLDVKLMVIVGSMVLSKDYYNRYYEKAMKIRRIIKEAITFSNYDVIAIPVKISENNYTNQSLYAFPLLAGLPSLTFSIKGYGLQLIANSKCEESLLGAYRQLMKELA